jgi:hypothetical protein
VLAADTRGVAKGPVGFVGIPDSCVLTSGVGDPLGGRSDVAGGPDG